MIDDQSPDKSWAKAISLEQKRKALNQRILDMNARIKSAYRLGVDPIFIAADEGVSVHYVRQIAVRWER